MIIQKGINFENIKKPKQLHGMKCFFCILPATEEHHCLNGRAYRKKSDEDGLTVALCSHCHWAIHNKTKHYYTLKKIAQEVYEKTHTREEWMSRYHKNYLYLYEV